jgi:hypothetical protein
MFLLLAAVLAGFLVGLGRARWQNQTYSVPGFQSIWLIVVAFLPQLFIAYLPVTRHLFTDSLAAATLLASLTLFLAFAWLNRRLPGMPILIVGLLLNFMVIAANGGWMPISPQTADLLTGKDILQVMNLGGRLGEKDILLSAQNTHFEFLADRFLLPEWIPYKSAFSLGDILIALGAFWLLAGAIHKTNTTNTINTKGIGA